MSTSNTINASEMADIQRDLAHFSRDLSYYSAHYDELLAQYPGKWVAIYGESVIDAAGDHAALVRDLRARGIPPERTLISNPSAEQETWVL